MRNLTAAEIVSQILIARDHLKEWPGAGRNSQTRQITNVVLMGMGEPLYNFDNVRDAISIVADGEGLSVSKRRITLSTAGVVPMIARAGDEIGSMLAISLHAVRDEIRDVIVPLNKKYPIKDLLKACREYPGVSNARRITFEYVMLKGVNDSAADAKQLVRLMAGIPAKINLIPFNPWPGAPYECSDWEQIETFGEIVNRAGYASPIRTPRGRDIMAACGQLKSESVKQRASDKLAELRSRELAPGCRIKHRSIALTKKPVKKVVLAYSGGLDTSVILKWLQENYGCEIVTFTADLGQGEELGPARKKAEMLGIKPGNIHIEDLREEFVRDYVLPDVSRQCAL